MKPQEEKNRVMDRVMSVFMQSKNRPTESRLLYAKDGSLAFPVYQHLRKQRDNRKVVITE